MKKYIYYIVLFFSSFLLSGTAFALPSTQYDQNIFPFVTNYYDLGTTTNIWNRVFTNFASTSVLSTYGNIYIGTTSTTTIKGDTATSTFSGGIASNLLNITSSTASSTFANGINITGGCFSINGSCVGSGGSGTVTSVNASGGTTGLSFTGGPITTSGTLTLSGTLGIANGGTNSTFYPSNSLIFYNGSSFIATSSQLTIGSLNATTTATSTFLGSLYVASTTATSTFSGGLSSNGLVSTNGLSVYGGGVLLPNGSIANSALSNSSLTLNTNSPLSGGGSVSLGGTLTVSCATCATFAFPWTPTTYGNSTSTLLQFNNGFISSASSTFAYAGTTTFSGAIYSASTTATSTFLGGVSANGLRSTNGITVSNGSLLLANPLTLNNGGTNNTTNWIPNSIVTVNAQGDRLVATSSFLTVSSLAASSTNATSTFLGGVGIGTTSPYLGFSVVGDTHIGGQVARDYASTTGAQTYNINWRAGSVQRFIINQDSTFIVSATSSNPLPYSTTETEICQDDVGSHIGTWANLNPTPYKWTIMGTTTIYAAADSCTDVFFRYDPVAHYFHIASTSVLNASK